MWALADVVGLFSNNVGPFSPNVGQRVRIFSANVGPNRPMLSGRGIYVLRSLQLDDATLRNARGRALEISHAEYSDTVLAYLDPAQREQLQDEQTWITRQLFVGDLIDQILAVPPDTIA